ncbi:MAG: ion channel [Planctomycetota bacterium]|nr:ion channel [Planctomycetota bacterium]
MIRTNEDLGFGTRAATRRGERLLHRDGSFAVRRVGRGLLARLSAYHALVTMSWPRFIGLVAGAFFGVNAVFAVLYLMLGADAVTGTDATAAHGPFLERFFMSVHTFTGVGYGNIVPATLAANVVMAIESFAGLLSYALATGLVFARFARPLADIVFSEKALIAPYRDGGRAIMIRIANQRNNQILELGAQLVLSTIERRPDMVTRRFQELPLERAHIPTFPLSWTIVHEIDADSPFAQWTEDYFREHDAEILVLLNGIDETTSQPVHSRTSYKCEDLVWNARFQSPFARHEAGNPTAIDIRRLHDFERLDLPSL